MELKLVLVIGFVTLLLAALYAYLTRNNKFFERFPIPCLPVETLFGSQRGILLKRISLNGFIRASYASFPGAKMYGMFELLTPMFVIRDPELVKRIMVKDFDHFINHRSIVSGDSSNNSSVLFTKALFNLKGQRWRNVRTTLSPTFTGSKMRQMFTMMVECSENMVQALDTSAGQECEVKELFVRFTNDVIASCAFGVHVNSFRDKENVFFRYGKEICNFNRLPVFLKFMGYQFVPKLMAWLDVDIFDRKHVQFFADLFKSQLQEREQHGIVRPDMIHLLMQAAKGKLRHLPQEHEELESFATAKESNEEKLIPEGENTETLSEMEMIAQCLVFFLAGFDIIASSISFLMYDITIAADIQERLYEEIREVSESLDGKSLTYDALLGMRYLDMVVSEGLRRWPPNPASDRQCNQDYKVPGEGDAPDVIIPKGVTVSIPIVGLHHDPQIYPDPDRFDPERFNEENRHKIPLGAYLPFGLGPRNCIASRFALMEIKAIVYHLLLNYEFQRTERTQVPIQLAKGFVPLMAEKGIHLKLKPRRLE